MQRADRTAEPPTSPPPPKIQPAAAPPVLAGAGDSPPPGPAAQAPLGASSAAARDVPSQRSCAGGSEGAAAGSAAAAGRDHCGKDTAPRPTCHLSGAGCPLFQGTRARGRPTSLPAPALGSGDRHQPPNRYSPQPGSSPPWQHGDSPPGRGHGLPGGSRVTGAAGAGRGCLRRRGGRRQGCGGCSQDHCALCWK